MKLRMTEADSTLPTNACVRSEPLMVWALRAGAARRAVHVSMLSPQENGASCGCLCYACGDKLRAINVDKPASHFEKQGSQRPHFKHDHGAGDRKCLSVVAQMVALAHFVEQDEVLLPSQSLPARRRMANGKVIDTLKETPATTARVLERHWIDNQSAVLVLDDGSELAVTIRTTHTLGQDGVSRSVLSFAGLRKPELAGWSKEQILAHLRLPGWMKWESHWSDKHLAESAAQDLADREAQLLGDIPREWLDGLSGKMASETILHWVIKRAIERRRMLKVPEIRIPRTRLMPDGTVASDSARRAEHTLIIDRVTFERRVGDLVPDVVCWASKMGGNGEPFQLLIEAAVTHYVDDAKRQKILSSGIACIQVRADMFSRAGSVPVGDIERMVCSDAAVKEWICHPDMSHEVKLADIRLERKALDIQARMDEEERVRAQLAADQETLNHWYRETSDAALAKGYLKALLTSWRGADPPMMGTAKVNVDALWQALSSRKIVDGPRSNAESKDGLLHLLWKIRSLSSRSRHTDHAIELARSASRPSWNGRAPFAALAMYALRAYHGSGLRHTSDLYRETEEQIRSSLQAGEETFVRLIDLDPLIHLLFPEMSKDLIKSSATPSVVQEVRTRRMALEARAREIAQRRARRLRVVSEGRAKQEASLKRAAIDAEIMRFASKARWVRTQLSAQDAGKLIEQFGNSASIASVEPKRVIRLALDLKAQGRSIQALLEALDLSHPEDVRKVVELLHLASVCVADDSLLRS